MNIEHLLKDVAAGAVSVDDALLHLKKEPFEDLGFAKVDHHRKVRQGAAEVVYGEGKSADQIAGIVKSLSEDADCVLVTRLDAEKAAILSDQCGLTYHAQARVGVVGSLPTPDGNGTIVVAAAGTSDLPVAEEAALTAEALGNKVVRLYDVGVAGIHRLFASLDELMSAQVVIAVAGMEGALPSVVAGMVSAPVIAVPTSVGYGASLGGLSALLAMLNSCASGVSVVNIDNGFGAAFQAHQINHLKVPGAVEAPEVDEEATVAFEAVDPDATVAFAPVQVEEEPPAPEPEREVRQIFLDLSQAATRASLQEQLDAQMTEKDRMQRAQILHEARIPFKHHHDLAEINETLDKLVAPEGLKQHFREVYAILAQAEATAHGVPVEETHFHEVGNGLALLNALNIITAFYVLEPCVVSATPIQTGKGQVECAHGTLDIPAPATAAILATGLPVVAEEDLLEGELCTPTSAALIKHFVSRFVDEAGNVDLEITQEMDSNATIEAAAPADRTSAFARIDFSKFHRPQDEKERTAESTADAKTEQFPAADPGKTAVLDPGDMMRLGKLFSGLGGKRKDD